MEINVALDELLGLRGPLSTLIRNLLWLLAFNATYLGIFAFVPRTVGSAVNAGLLNTTLRNKLLNTIPYVQSDDPEQLTVQSAFASLNEESSQRDTTFRLPDVATVTLGYFSIATMIVVMRYGWVVSQKFRQRFSLEGTRINTNERQEAHPARFHERMMPDDDRDVVEPGAANTAIGIALDATVAVVKVGILLFLKMFLLPLVLGLWLDASTMPLFGHTIADRASFAGGDLFSFVLLHWVAGITFMLLVTVFLLQLREVTHPDLLARLIRPQEPQPDLLGNLMHETVSTHIKRMALSLGIYAPLLTMHITLPVKLFIVSGLGNRFTFFHLNFWHILMPQMQIPLELIIFHLSMLALLERYKNSIGGLQHSWMVFMCQKMGLTEYVLPHSVAKFELFGTKEIFLPETDGVDKGPLKTVDPFWYELVARKKDIDSFVEANIQRISTDSPERVAEGETKANGDRVLTESLDFIRLPSNGEENGDGKKSLLRTKIGRFRLNRVDFDDLSTPVIEFWREVPGGEIDRPPVGWDDLGAGGAFVQGRWAWGKERKSVIEGTVAERTPFRASESQRQPLHLMLKVAALFVLSWVAISVTVLGFVSAPLAVGRSLYYLFRIPQNYIHDPLAFVIGACLFFPMMSLLMRTINLAEGKPTERLREWISGFHLPPRQKVLVFLESWILWIVLAPMALGISYEIAAVKTSKWFGREEQLADIHSILVCWILGTSVLHAWAFFAYYSVFTKQFWRNIGNGILEPPLDENGAGPAGNARNRGGENMEQAEDHLNAPFLSWQGKDGRIARFFNVWRSAILDWDWERVDRTTLLEDFARPISKQLASALVGSSLSFQFSLYLASAIASFERGGIVGKCSNYSSGFLQSVAHLFCSFSAVPFLGVIERGLFRMAVFRICMATHVIVQLCSAFRGRLEGWFQAAHAAARDDRYLIGEVLMNYNADDEDYNAAVR
jgi:E3 ubiquitin-protein ligase MARCH6